MIDEPSTPTPPLRVVLVGAAHLDRVAISDSAFRAASSNPGRLIERFGGGAFNAGLALRAFGASVHFVSACGGDETGERVGIELDRLGIGDGRIAWLDRRSASYTALVDAGGELIGGVADMAIYDRLVPRVLSRQHVKARLREADGILVDANLPASALEHLAASETAKPVAAIAVSPAKAPRLADALPRLSMLFASRTELAAVLKIDARAEDEAMLRAVSAAGLRRAIVTDGPRPVLVIDGSDAWRQTPPPVDRIADVVGAGDTLAGAAFAALLDGSSLHDSVRLGLAAASLRITTGLDATTAETARAIAGALPVSQPIPV